MAGILIEIANTPMAQVQRTAGYLMWAATFVALALAAHQGRWRFKYFYDASALHTCIVLVWAGFLAVGIDPPQRVTNAATSVTMGLVFVAGLYGWLFSKDDL